MIVLPAALLSQFENSAGPRKEPGQKEKQIVNMSLFVLKTDPPGPEARAVAEKELRETEENVKKGLETLKKLLQEDKTIYYPTDDDFLMIYLRPCKFYPESALALMRRVADFKVKQAALLHNLLPSDEKEAFTKYNVVNVFTNLDHKNRRVMVVNAGKTWDPSKVNSDQIFRLFYLIHQLALQEPETQIYGSVVIMDFDGLSMKQVTGLSPAWSMRLLTFIQEAMPMRLKAVHFVKQPWLFNMVWQMIKPFVKEKLRTRMFFHGSKMSSLHTHIPPSHLPKNYDGELPEIDYSGADWYPVAFSYEDKIREWNTYGHRKNE
ncbi:PREDICTED: alpha-tocopherol transfer protein-like [Wasmannia auropunctata]|uniref:alpha-tocopherol transfer protein-like n=1 Tax=Wasmannia auropunctata TaxID=64793 RepID=UPI0005EE756B|nr:PREDICTED: alpha-tocopherol transfer protein-like [Wasmannia auropunctata]